MPETLVPIGINNMTYFIALFPSVKQHNCVLGSTLYATQYSIFNHPHFQREKHVAGYRSKIYVTVFSGRPRQGYFDGRSRAAQRSNRRARFAPAADRQQVAQTILRRTPRRLGEPSPLWAPAQFFPLNW